MLKKIITKLFPDNFAGIADDHRHAFILQTTFINITRARIFAAILVAIQIPLILVDLRNRSMGLWVSTPGYCWLFVMHLLIGAVFLLYFLATRVSRPKQPADITPWHRSLVIAFAGLGLLLPAAVSIVDQQIHGQITVYTIAAFWVAAGLYLDALTSFLLYASVTALLMLGLQRFQPDAAVFLGHAINGPLLSLLAWLLSRSVYAAKEREFVQGTIIQQQRLQVKELETKQIILEKEKLLEAVKQSTRSLQESEAKFRALAETSPAAIIIHRGAVCLYANPAGEAVTGYSVQEILETEFWVLIHAEYRSMVKEREQALLGGDGPVSCEFKVLRKNFDERWVLMTAGQVEYEGSPAVVATLVDITDRKLLEGKLRYAQKLEAGGRLAGSGV